MLTKRAKMVVEFSIYGVIVLMNLMLAFTHLGWHWYEMLARFWPLYVVEIAVIVVVGWFDPFN